MQRLILAWVLLSLFQPAISQSGCKLRISGMIREAESGEALPYTEVLIDRLGQGTLSESDGSYELKGLCPGEYVLTIHHISCEHQDIRLSLQRDTVVDILLEHGHVELESILVRDKRVPLALTQAQVEADSQLLASSRSQSLGDALRFLPGLNVLSTGATVAKPVINGFHSNSLVILQDGVRLEGQQWGQDHAPEIDFTRAGQVRVIKGVSGIRYGPNAIGGVILVDQAPFGTRGGPAASFGTTAWSNGRGASLWGMFESKLSRARPLYARIRGSLRRAGNLQSPDYGISNTGIRDLGVSYDLAWNPGELELRFSYSFLNQSIGIFRGSHIGNLTDLRNAIDAKQPLFIEDFTYRIDRPYQQVQHESARLLAEWTLNEQNALEVQVSRQFNRRSEYDAHRPFGLPPDGSIPQVRFEITTWNLGANWHHSFLRHMHGDLGIQADHQRNTVDLSAFLPDYRQYNAGVYWIEHWKRYPNPFEFELGIRYDWRLNRPELQGGIQDLSFRRFSWSGGMSWRPDPEWRIQANLGTAWRMPSINELFSYGVHHGTASFETGDPGLKAERAYSLSSSGEWKREGIGQFQWNLFFNRVADYIYLQPYDSSILTIRGAFPYYAYRQADALVWGGDADFRICLGPRFQAGATYTLVRARNLDTDGWINLMPADRVTLSLRYQGGREHMPWFLETRGIRVFRQTRYDAQAELLPAPPAYFLWEWEAGIRKSQGRHPWEAGLKGQNVLNAPYRDYMDRFRFFVDAPGTNLIAYFTIHLEKKPS